MSLSGFGGSSLCFVSSLGLGGHSSSLGFKTSMVVVDSAGLDGLCCSFVIAGWGPWVCLKLLIPLL